MNLNLSRLSFAGAMPLSQLVIGIMTLFFMVSSLPASDLIYVSMMNGTVVTYDTSGTVGSTIAATQTQFASTPLKDWAMGLAFDSGGNLFVASSADTVSKFPFRALFLILRVIDWLCRSGSVCQTFTLTTKPSFTWETSNHH